MNKFRYVTLIALLLAACSSGLDGTYSDPTGILEYTFESDGKVYAGAMGAVTELEYEIDGNRLKIMASGGGANQVLTINDDGSISGPMGIRLTRKSEASR